MKLKMYLRGLGIGMIITAIVMGIVLGGRSRTQATMTDEEIIARARELGMEDRATLMQYAAANSAASAASLTTLQDEPSPSTSSTPLPEGEAGEEDEGETGEEDGEGDALTDGDGEEAEGDSEGEPSQSASLTVPPEGEPSEEDEGEASENEETISVNGLPQPISAGSGASAAASASSSADTGLDASAGTSSSTSYFEEDDDNAEQAFSYREDTEDEEDEEEEVLTGSTVVTIPKGVSSETASSHLAQAGVVDDAIAFNSYLVRNNYDRYIQSGTKQIPRGASYEDVAKIITGRR